MTPPIRWGLCATIKAPALDIVRFAAFHLSAGAHRIHVFLDAPNPAAFAALKAHPKCRVNLCDDTYWQRQGGKRPVKHQVRQSRNATRCYHRAGDVDWLIHMDVDEFLVTHQPVTTCLTALPATIQTARARPMEALALQQGDDIPTAFKRFLPNGPDRRATVRSLYPTYGAYIRAGFVSHVAGKLFVRTGLDNVELRIHNVFQGDIMNPGETEMKEIALAHCHATSWATWRAAYDFRHAKGSYRADLASSLSEDSDGMSLHDLFAMLLRTEGESGLRHFFDEVCADTPTHRARLKALGLLAEHALDLNTHVHQHFPDFTDG